LGQSARGCGGFQRWLFRPTGAELAFIRARWADEAKEALAIAYARYLESDPDAEITPSQIERIIKRLGEPVPLGRVR
jgi:hypothetical protein